VVEWWVPECESGRLLGCFLKFLNFGALISSFFGEILNRLLEILSSNLDE
jgi:hypothetical protein